MSTKPYRVTITESAIRSFLVHVQPNEDPLEVASIVYRHAEGLDNEILHSFEWEIDDARPE